MQQIEPAIALHIEDKVKFAGVLIQEEMAALDTRSVQQDVNAPAAGADLVHDLGYSLCVGEVNRKIVRRAAGSSYAVDGGQRGLRPFQGRQFLPNHGWRGALATRLNAGVQIAFEAFLVGCKAFEVRIIRVGLRHQVKQVESAARSSRQVGGDGRYDASRRSGDQENRVLLQYKFWFSVGCRLLPQADTPAQSLLVADFDRPGIPQGFIDQGF